MYLVVFGDVHGNLKDMYRYVQKWEQEQNIQITAILQTGDLGVFQLGGPLDKATSRYMKTDPTELGCADYITGKKKATHLTLFVRGNHEDFNFLMEAGSVHIDPFGLIRHLNSGEVFTIERGKETVKVSGLGGILCRQISEHEQELGHKYFTDEECNRLLSLEKDSVDILLFHEAPKGYGAENVSYGGAEEITLIIEYIQPHFAFYGHYGYSPEPFRMGKTLCVGMNNPRALRLPRRDGAMGIIDTSNWTFEFIAG